MTWRKIMVPLIARSGAETLERVALAWNGSLEAARAVSLSLPLIERAKAITVITVHNDGPFSPDAEAFAEYLLWHGLSVERVCVERGARGGRWAPGRSRDGGGRPLGHGGL